jgi:hypothetical protein
MTNTNGHKALKIVLVLSIIVLLLSVVGMVNYALALKASIIQDVEIGGWIVFLRSVVVLAVEGLSAGVALFFIIRGSVLAAHNSSGVFLVIMVMALLVKGARFMNAPTWQLFLGAAWLTFLAWLLWRIVPNTSLNQDAAKRRAG